MNINWKKESSNLQVQPKDSSSKKINDTSKNPQVYPWNGEFASKQIIPGDNKTIPLLKRSLKYIINY